MIKSAINEIENLFGTKAKGNTIVYFNDVNYVPIPRPVVNAVNAIMEDYPDLAVKIGLYSVTVYDPTVTPDKAVVSSVQKKNLK
jgi:hypothetical protein